MTEENFQSRLKELIVERLFLDLDPQSIEDEVELAEYGIDSFLLLELVVAMEETFEVHFEPTDITAQALKTVKSLHELILSKK